MWRWLTAVLKQTSASPSPLCHRLSQHLGPLPATCVFIVSESGDCADSVAAVQKLARVNTGFHRGDRRHQYWPGSSSLVRSRYMARNNPLHDPAMSSRSA